MPTDFLSYVVSGFLLRGALLAIEISVLAMAFGLVLGLGLALMRLSRHAAVRGPAWCYVWFVRGTPLLLQLVFIYDVLPAIGIKLDTFTTAVIGFSLNEAAFGAEIIRGGVLSVSRNQSIAAAALGMPPLMTLRRIVMPQAMRAILPGIANQAISMIKGTSIASVIFVNELTFRAEQIVGQNFRFFTVFAAAAVIYLAMTSFVALGQIAAERRFDFLRERSSGAGGWLAAVGWRRRTPPAPEAASELPARPERLPALIGEICREIVGGGDARPMIVCRNVQKSYGEREVLKSIDLTVNRGEVVVIMGPSGSGKSTLLRLVNHLEPVDWGEITIDGKHVGYERVPGGFRPVRRLAQARAEARIGMVFQQFNLFEHLTALENLTEAPIRVYRREPKEARAIARRLLAGVGLGGARDRPSPPRRRRPGRPCRPPAAPALRRPAAARRDRAGARDLAAGDAVRRTDVGAGSGTGRRGPRRHPRVGGSRHDHDHRHPRGALRPRCRRPHCLYRRRDHRRGGRAQAGARPSGPGTHPPVSAHGRARGCRRRLSALNAPAETRTGSSGRDRCASNLPRSGHGGRRQTASPASEPHSIRWP
jgi:His/Glu/Gln/Arg/opine family amino acid ABC transporter permease subunit